MAQSKDGVLDLIIIGAGIYGISAANTYLTLHPSANIRVLDSDSGPGGVWSRSRLYPNFWSQTGARLAGFPDEKFEIPDDAESYWDLFEARHLTGYLERYVERREALKEKFIFGCWVEKVVKVEDVWKIDAKVLEKNEAVSYRSSKLIVATGLHSKPNMPNLAGSSPFNGPIIHQKDFGRSGILTSSEPNPEQHAHITVLGGSKSAADIVYAAAKDPALKRKVNWVIRVSGEGPLLLNGVKGFGKYKNLTETGSTRALGCISSANPFLPENWWSWFIHKTYVGEWLLEKVWSRTEINAAKMGDFDGREGALEGFKDLKSATSIRWRSGHLGLLQRDDYWDVVARNVRVFKKDVRELNEGAVVLEDEDGTEVRSDVLICCTGWKFPAYSFFDADENARLGLPIGLNDEERVKAERMYWTKLERDADLKVMERWPYLAYAPKSLTAPLPKTTNYKLYNMTVPITDHTIAFLGQFYVPNSYHVALVQSLYAISILDGAFSLPPREEVEREIAFLNRWCARRYPAYGYMGNFVEFEMLSFTDSLLEKLGLSSHRDKGSWWADLTDPVLASDYAGLVDEYRRKYREFVE